MSFDSLIRVKPLTTRLFRNLPLLLALFGASSQAQYTISTVAGGGPPDGLQALTTAIGPPAGITLDAGGNLYVACCLNRVYKVAPDGTFTAVAGNGATGYSGDGGAATSATLNLSLSSGVAVDSSGNVYIADTLNNRIRKVSGGIITTVAGNGSAGYSGDGGAATSAALNGPDAVAVDSAGNLYIADSKNNRVRKVSGGTISTVAGTGTGGFTGDGAATSVGLNAPNGVAVDASGNVYIADSGNNRIRKLAGGNLTTIAGNGTAGFTGDGGAATSATLNGPLAVAVNAAGTNVFILDFLNRRVREVSGGTISTVAGAGIGGPFPDGTAATSATLYEPEGIAVDSGGTLYISDSLNGYVRKVTSGVIHNVAGNGTLFYFGDGGSAVNATLGTVFGVALGSGGTLYVADSGNNRVRSVSGGTIATAAGGGSSLGDGGPATSAIVNFPQAVALDTSGNLYIADTNNHLVRKVSGGTITTVAGTGTAGFSGDGGSATSAALHSPSAVAVDSQGNLYIADFGNGRVRKVVGGTITTVAGGGVQTGDGIAATSAQISPLGVAVDGTGNLYIADGNRIRKVAGGTITTVAGTGAAAFSGDGGAATSATLNGPRGIALDSTGNLYIADTMNNRIREVASGTITTIAGGGTAGLGDGGPATSANLLNPGGVTVDSAGDVYVADTYNHRVRLLTPNGGGGGGGGPTTLALSPSALRYGATPGGATRTGAQTVLVAAAPGVAWVASPNQSFISVSPASGTGSGSFDVTIVPGALPASGSISGQISVTASGVTNSPQTVSVTATIVSTSQIIIRGSFDTPTNNTTGVAGSIAVTGWALDPIGITKVDIWRAKIGSEQSNGLVYIGDAVFVPGARPDVEAAYPTLPQSDRAGWGYLMLTNFLPNSDGSAGYGNGTYQLHAIAHDISGKTLDLGTRTITCDNAHAVKPFGAIDTPGQGETISGAGYLNYGWALAHQPNQVPMDGSTIQVVIDGQVVGHPIYNLYRSDIATLFPGYANSNGAVGVWTMDTTTMTNGLHTIAWVVTDNANNADGIGSRYFSVLNSGQRSPQPMSAATPVTRTALALRISGKPTALRRAKDGSYLVKTRELGQIELQVGASEGYLLVNGERRDLPVGSSLKDGVFYWGLGPGFLGDYRLVFVRPGGRQISATVEVAPLQ